MRSLQQVQHLIHPMPGFRVTLAHSMEQPPVASMTLRHWVELTLTLLLSVQHSAMQTQSAGALISRHVAGSEATATSAGWTGSLLDLHGRSGLCTTTMRRSCQQSQSMSWMTGVTSASWQRPLQMPTCWERLAAQGHSHCLRPVMRHCKQQGSTQSAISKRLMGGCAFSNSMLHWGGSSRRHSAVETSCSLYMGTRCGLEGAPTQSLSTVLVCAQRTLNAAMGSFTS
mmetsp:Transcript_66666/g.124473  ORF Transcript_66666/g.124473 Transcript_66666/m.124473 type:complete len:227 (-) Transcript_66666:866-1546(-)